MMERKPQWYHFVAVILVVPWCLCWVLFVVGPALFVSAAYDLAGTDHPRWCESVIFERDLLGLKR